MTAAGAGRLVITICPREQGRIRLPITRGGPARRLDARAIAQELKALVSARGLGACVNVQEGCAGGCQKPGPNITVTTYAAPQPGKRPDHVALAWKTYVYTLPTLASLTQILDDNLPPGRGTPSPFRRAERA